MTHIEKNVFVIKEPFLVGFLMIIGVQNELPNMYSFGTLLIRIKI